MMKNLKNKIVCYYFQIGVNVIGIPEIVKHEGFLYKKEINKIPDMLTKKIEKIWKNQGRQVKSFPKKKKQSEI
jgi:hypothetical protein